VKAPSIKPKAPAPAINKAPVAPVKAPVVKPKAPAAIKVVPANKQIKSTQEERKKTEKGVMTSAEAAKKNIKVPAAKAPLKTVGPAKVNLNAKL